MTFTEALDILIHGQGEEQNAAIGFIEDEMSVDNRDGLLHEWLWSGVGMYTPDITIESLNEEWSQLCADSDKEAEYKAAQQMEQARKWFGN